MNFIDSILEWFKKMFGVEYQPKDDTEILTDFFDTDEISIASVLAQRLSSLTLSDVSADVVGENERAKYLDDFMQHLIDTKMQAIAEVCLGSGDCIVKPNTDGKRFGIDIIPSSDFRIVDSIGDFVYSMIVKCDEMVKDRNTYERYEFLKLDEDENGIPYYVVHQACFKNGTEVDITSIDGWEDIKVDTYIPNVERLLIGRFMCPRLNREDVNSPNGVPITFGADEIVEEVKNSWRRFNEEFEKTEPMIFADKSIFKSKRKVVGEGTEDVISIPKGKDRVIMSVNGARNVDAQPLIHEFAPSIRDGSLTNGIEQNLKMLELFCGLDNGVLSRSDSVYQNTDAIRKSIQNTFSFITAFRKVLESGITDLIYAIDILCNVNEITPMGAYDISIDWSDEFAQSYGERFNELLQAHNLNLVSDAEMRAWVMGEDLDLSKEMIDEIQSNLMDRTMTQERAMIDLQNGELTDEEEE